jgi:hypothetical protein
MSRRSGDGIEQSHVGLYGALRDDGVKSSIRIRGFGGDGGILPTPIKINNLGNAVCRAMCCIV